MEVKIPPENKSPVQGRQILHFFTAITTPPPPSVVRFPVVWLCFEGFFQLFALFPDSEVMRLCY